MFCEEVEIVPTTHKILLHKKRLWAEAFWGDWRFRGHRQGDDRRPLVGPPRIGPSVPYGFCCRGIPGKAARSLHMWHGLRPFNSEEEIEAWQEVTPQAIQAAYQPPDSGHQGPTIDPPTEPVDRFLPGTRAPPSTPPEWQCDRDINCYSCMAVATGQQCIQMKQHWDNCAQGVSPKDRRLSRMVPVKAWHRHRRNLGGLRSPPRAGPEIDLYEAAEAERVAEQRLRDEKWLEEKAKKDTVSPRNRWRVARVAPRHTPGLWLSQQPDLVRQCFSAAPMMQRPFAPTHGIGCPTQDELDAASVAPERRVEALSCPREVPGCEKIRVVVPENLPFAGLIHDTIFETKTEATRRMTKEECLFFGIAHLDPPR